MVFFEGWQDCSKGFPKGKAREKSQGAAQGNTVLPDSLIWIYILFQIDFFIFQNSNKIQSSIFFQGLLGPLMIEIANSGTTLSIVRNIFFYFSYMLFC